MHYTLITLSLTATPGFCAILTAPTHPALVTLVHPICNPHESLESLESHAILYELHEVPEVGLQIRSQRER